MTARGDDAVGGTTTRRLCTRRGCGEPVKKPTAKYCSVHCCAIDPERRDRIRVQSRRAHSRPLTMTRQLQFTLQATGFDDPEAQLAQVGAMREDVPSGMSRLAG